jgi:pyrrolidone-carboxylate peptidase
MTEFLPLLIVTYFEPFDGRSGNRSETLARELSKKPELTERFSAVRLCRVPVVYDAAPRIALDCIRTPEGASIGTATRPWVLSLGEWKGESLRIETAAHNRDHAPNQPDNDGKTRSESPILPGGEPSLGFRFPMTELFSSPKLRSLSPRVSPSPGGFLCNHLAYHLTRELAHDDTPFLFVHTGYEDSRPVPSEANALAEALSLAALAPNLPDRNPVSRSEIDSMLGAESEPGEDLRWWLSRLRSNLTPSGSGESLK